MVLTCRFYKNKYPEVEDVVMVNVRSIAEMGAYVHLLEYNNIEGMILLSELSRRRIRSINKLIRIGRNECVVVIRVDKDKGGLLITCILKNEVNLKPFNFFLQGLGLLNFGGKNLWKVGKQTHHFYTVDFLDLYFSLYSKFSCCCCSSKYCKCILFVMYESPADCIWASMINILF